MKQLFLVKTSQLITTEKGTDKVEKQPWIVEAQTIYEALTNAQAHAEAETLNDFRILSITHSGFNEIHPAENENNFKVVINWVMLDDDKGVEKRQKYNMLINADDFTHAEKRLQEIQTGTAQNWEIFNITQSNITDIVIN